MTPTWNIDRATIIALLVFSSGLLGCGRAAGEGAGPTVATVSHSSCALSLNVSGPSPPYAALYQAALRNPHLVCPFDFHNTSTAIVYLSAKDGKCDFESVGEYKVISARVVENPMSEFKQCSDVLSSFDEKRIDDTSVDSYVWSPARADEKLSNSQSKEQMKLGVRVHNAIALSGVPIVDDNLSNVGLCFEEKTGTNLSPKALLSGVGIELPAWAVEREMPGKSCDEAIAALGRINQQ